MKKETREVEVLVSGSEYNAQQGDWWLNRCVGVAFVFGFVFFMSLILKVSLFMKRE